MRRAVLRQTLELFQEAAAGRRRRGAEGDRRGVPRAAQSDRLLRAQMQAYAACDDPDIRAVVRRGYGGLVGYVERVSGGRSEALRDFFADRDAAERALVDGPARRGAVGRRLLEGCRRQVNRLLIFGMEITK